MQTNMTTADNKEPDVKEQFKALVEQMNEALHVLYDFPPKFKSAAQVSGFNQFKWTLNANFTEIRKGNLERVQSLNIPMQRLYGITK